MLPRGIRNNNPLNIRIGCKWLGEVEHPTDKDFEQFTCMHYGIRAACILLRRYIERYHLTTIPEIISRWAPSSENNTHNYVLFVQKQSGIGNYESISFEDKETIVKLVAAMAQYECGRSINDEDIRLGYDMARNA